MTERHPVPTAQAPSRPVEGHRHPRVATQRPTAGRHAVTMLNGFLLGLLTVMVGGLLLFQLTHRPTFEYQTVAPSDYRFVEEMNRLGAEGWKTESCRRATNDSVLLPSVKYECILSRPRVGW